MTTKRRTDDSEGSYPIIVTGPQRSGSRIASHILCSDLGGVFVDELEYCLPLPDNAVVQAPFLLKFVLELSFILPDAKFVFMQRNPKDIVASMQRVEWYADYCSDPNFYPAYVKHCYDYIDMLKRTLKRDRWFDIEYDALKAHHLFVEDRTGFTTKQHLPGVPNGPKTWRNDEYIRTLEE